MTITSVTPPPLMPDPEGAVVARAVHRGPGAFAHALQFAGHRLIVDEPLAAGGGGTGPDPAELLAGALAACTAMTIRVYAGQKGWNLGTTSVEVCFRAPDGERAAHYEVEVSVDPRLTADQIKRLLAIAGRCPVRRALGSPATFGEVAEITAGAPVR